MTQSALPVQPIPAQSFEATLGTQDCTITLRQFATGLFMDLSVSGSQVIAGAYCNDRVNLVRRAYLGFSGALYFVDTSQQGQDPSYDGLGSRYLLIYEDTVGYTAAASSTSSPYGIPIATQGGALITTQGGVPIT